MKAKFIEDADLRLAIQFEPETDDERLLLRAFDEQCRQHNQFLRVQGWGIGGPYPGLRHIRVYSTKEKS